MFTCQPTKSSNFSCSGVKVRANLLRKNYSRNFSSIRSAPLLLESWLDELPIFVGYGQLNSATVLDFLHGTADQPTAP